MSTLIKFPATCIQDFCIPSGHDDNYSERIDEGDVFHPNPITKCDEERDWGQYQDNKVGVQIGKDSRTLRIFKIFKLFFLKTIVHCN